jgi:SAM-dependent methyltransferase
MSVAVASDCLDNDSHNSMAVSDSSELAMDESYSDYFRQCYGQPELHLPWDIPGPQPDIVSLQASQPDLFASPVLDVGAGFGSSTIWLAAKGLDVVACDVSADAMAEAERRLARSKESDISGLVRFIVCDVCTPNAESLLGQGQFATVLDSAAFHCVGGLVQQQAYVRAITACTRPGGHLILLAYSDLNPLGGAKQVRRVSKSELESHFGTETGWEIVCLRECRYCCMDRGQTKKGFALKAWLLVAKRLGE